MSTLQSPSCAKCGAPLAAFATEGFCSACLLERGLSSQAAIPTAPLSRFGDYELIEEIARGGMGVVYRARQVSLNRVVALKTILSGALAGAEERHRFRAEAETAARLQHPNIITIHEVGEHDGNPFFSMDLVEGQSLAQLARNEPLPARRAVQYLRTIAEAVQFAHSRGVLHRDLKPSNILIDQTDQPRVTDFGLAKQLDSAATPTPRADITQTGHVLGSPNFMPPEQAVGHSRDVGPASDVYSLGAVLYQLLTGRAPFVAETVMQILRLVVEAEPVPPRLLNPSIPRDLETICLKCLAKEPHRRYATAQELGEELRRFLSDEPIRARPIASAEKVWRWCRRNPALAASGAIALLLLLIVAIGSPISAFRINRERKRAETNATNEALQRGEADTQRENNRKRLVRMNVASGVRLMQQGDYLGALPWFVEALNLDGGHPEKEEHHRMRIAGVLEHSPRLVQAWFHGGPVTHVEFSKDGQSILAASKDSAACLWDIGSGKRLRVFSRSSHTTCAVLDPDGTHVATGCADGTVTIWNLATGKPFEFALHHTDAVTRVIFSPDGRRIMSASKDGMAVIWDTSSGKPLAKPLRHNAEFTDVRFSPDGRTVATMADGEDDDMRIWDAATGELKHRVSGLGRHVYGVSFSPDGSRVVGAGWGAARVVNVASGVEAYPALWHPRAIVSISYSADGNHILASGEDRTVRLWDAVTGKQLMSLPGHGHIVRDAAFSPDQKWIVTCSEDGTARIWDLSSQQMTMMFKQSGPVAKALFSPDGAHVLTAGDDGMVRLWDLANAGPREQVLDHKGNVWKAIFSRDAKWVLTASFDHTAQLWNTVTGEKMGPPLKHPDAVLHATFNSNATRVATASLQGTVQVWDCASGQPLSPLLLHSNPVHHVLFTPDGRRLITVAQGLQVLPGITVVYSGTVMVRVWDAESWFPITDSLLLEDSIGKADTSSDGLKIAAPCKDKTVRVWDIASGRVTVKISGLSTTPQAAAFSDDGEKLLIVSADGDSAEARVWNARTGTAISDPMRHRRKIYSAKFSPDGRHVATASYDGTARIWDATTGKPETPPLTHDYTVNDVDFSPNGTRVVTGGGDYAARAWDSSTGELLGPPFRHPGSADTLAVSPSGYHFVAAPRQSARGMETTAHLWHLTVDRRPVEHLQQLAQLLSGRRSDSTGSMVPIEPEEFPKLWEFMSKHYPEQFGRTVPPSPAWRWKQIENAKDPTWALLHLKHLPQSETNDQRYYVTRGRWLARAGRWTEAADDLAMAVEGESADHLRYNHLFPLLAVIGDVERYRLHCRRAEAKFASTRNPLVAERMAKGCLILPDSGVEWTAITNWVDTAISQGKNSSNFAYFQFAKGLAEYRLGNFGNVAQWMQGGLAGGTSAGRRALQVEARAIMAMTHFKLKQFEEARAELTGATQLAESTLAKFGSEQPGNNWADNIVAHVLLSEARALIDAK